MRQSRVCILNRSGKRAFASQGGLSRPGSPKLHKSEHTLISIVSHPGRRHESLNRGEPRAMEHHFATNVVSVRLKIELPDCVLHRGCLRGRLRFSTLAISGLHDPQRHRTAVRRIDPAPPSLTFNAISLNPANDNPDRLFTRDKAT